MNEAELLFSEILDCDRLSLCLNRDKPLNKQVSSLVSRALKNRIKGLPLQYILGKTEFMGLEFKVNKDVFIPRPETEILVETAIKIVRSSKFEVRSILDLGTGSGCVAISLAKFLPHADITAIDVSERAIKTAEQNALINNVRVNFLVSNLFTNFQLPTSNLQLITSNPPYIATKDIEGLQPELSYEPRLALDGGEDGLDFYRRLISETPDYLKVGGFLIMEMGFDQSSSIQNILTNSKKFAIIEVVKDYSDIERVIVARNQEMTKFQDTITKQIPNLKSQ